MATGYLSVHLLGSPGITWQQKAYSIARRQARALLFHLAATLQPHSRQQLSFLFWPDVAEARARKNLNRLLSYLHQTLPHQDMLILHKETVQLNPDWVWSDAGRFDYLCAVAGIEEARAAVKLYRGPFLDGFYLPNSPEYDFWLTEERSRTERLYLSTLSRLVEGFVEAGEYQQAIPYAEDYLKIDHLAEEMHRCLIVCQAATGKRAAAQAQYEKMVVTLEQELGVSPLPETVLAYQASLRGETPAPRTLPSPTTWSVLPSLDIPMVGRQASLSEVEEIYGRARSGGVILIDGEAGIGKSRLLKEFATRDHKVVINGNGYPSTQSLSFQPVIQALQVAVPHQWLWQGVHPVWLAEIAMILPEIVTQFPDLPQRVAIPPQQAQARLFEALTQVFLALAANASPLLLCVDDLHWADEMTLAWLTYFASHIPNSNLCLLATYRTGEAGQLVELRRSLHRSVILDEITLTGLEQNAIKALVQECGAAELMPASWVPRLQEITGGNPFFILEILSALIANGGVPAADSIPITRTIQDLVETRLARLTMVAQQVLDACAVLAPRLEFDLIELTSGRQEFELVDALDELANQNVLKIENEGYQFRHELVRQAVYQSLSPWRSQLLHKRAAAAFERIYRKKLAGEYASIAYHYDHAAQAAQAVHYYHSAALHAQSDYAYQVAIGYMQRALELLPAGEPEHELAVPFYELLGDLQANTGNFSTARENYNHSLRATDQNKPLQAASILRKCAAAFAGEFAYDEALPLLDRALEILEAQPGHGTREWEHCWLDVQLERIWVFYQKAMPEKIDEISARIRPIIEQAGTSEHQIRFLTGLNYAIVRKNRYRVSKEIAESEQRALAIAQEVGDAALICERQFNAGILSLLYGDVDAAVGYLSAGLELSQNIGLLPIKLQCLVYLIAAHRVQGNLEQVQLLSGRCSEAARLVGQPNYIGAALAHQAWLAYRGGVRKRKRACHQEPGTLGKNPNLPVSMDGALAAAGDCFLAERA